MLGAAAPGQARDELTNALRQGARIRLWMEGPARKLAKDYVRLAAINEGRDAVSDLLHTDGRIGLAKVEHEDQQFVVILPGDGPPVIVRAEPGS